jgi:hypothetical protein
LHENTFVIYCDIFNPRNGRHCSKLPLYFITLALGPKKSYTIFYAVGRAKKDLQSKTDFLPFFFLQKLFKQKRKKE